MRIRPTHEISSALLALALLALLAAGSACKKDQASKTSAPEPSTVARDPSPAPAPPSAQPPQQAAKQPQPPVEPAKPGAAPHAPPPAKPTLKLTNDRVGPIRHDVAVSEKTVRKWFPKDEIVAGSHHFDGRDDPQYTVRRNGRDLVIIRLGEKKRVRQVLVFEGGAKSPRGIGIGDDFAKVFAARKMTTCWWKKPPEHGSCALYGDAYGYLFRPEGVEPPAAKSGIMTPAEWQQLKWRPIAGLDWEPEMAH